MDRTTVQIKLVAVADIHLKQGEEIDVEIVIPMEPKEIRKNLVLMVGQYHAGGATGYAAMLAEHEMNCNKVKK
jgi:hypothetical protein